jgi:hypothetical protein
MVKQAKSAAVFVNAQAAGVISHATMSTSYDMMGIARQKHAPPGTNRVEQCNHRAKYAKTNAVS